MLNFIVKELKKILTLFIQNIYHILININETYLSNYILYKINHFIHLVLSLSRQPV
jgi:hypothetical protein